MKRAALATLLALAAIAPSIGAQESLERTGDVLAIVIPAAAGGATVLLDDASGSRRMFGAMVTNLALTYLGKAVTSRERPDGSGDDSLPSGHTSVSFQGAAFLHARYGWTYAGPAYAGAAVVAFSRVHADRHHVTDVLAGAALGSVVSFLFTDRFEGAQIRTNRIGNGYEVAVRFTR